MIGLTLGSRINFDDTQQGFHSHVQKCFRAVTRSANFGRTKSFLYLLYDRGVVYKAGIPQLRLLEGCDAEFQSIGVRDVDVGV